VYNCGVHKIVIGVRGCCLIAVLQLGAAPQPVENQPSPAWAYGVPNEPRARGGPPPIDNSPKHVPGSTQTLTIAQIRDYWNVGDWFPDEHPPMPDVVVHGRRPHVLGCAMCHMPSGKGRPENAPLAGLPSSYFVQQLVDFKNGLRTSADIRKTNTATMIAAAKEMTDEEMKQAASYFSSLKWTPWITVRETATVPRTRLTGNVFFVVPGGATEPIGNRIIETPEDAERFELRDPHSGFIAYVPPGSLRKGARLVSTGARKTTPCGICHGPDLRGLGPVPPIAGRSPSYIMRQLWDIQQGTRRGEWSPLMKPIVRDLTQDDMLSIAAYAASVGR
jgi:cytochrome c553